MAVTNITILESNEPAPPGWIKDPTDLNEGAGGEYLYLAYEKDGAARPVTDIYFLIGEDQPVPPGYEKIDVDLNKGAGGKYIYLTFTRGNGAPFEDLEVISSNDPAANPPSGYRRIDVDLNEGAGGKYIYLCYRS
ncbi:hypothetical protein [Streptomyces acidicola]|uniref:MABP domain-containing protein n=1 Tax=Streptomyces acidicola TaxID=2596892 RepID=A0A5N8X3E9_9ACTN|nr:hypothetical protein [Streptomyces acidicola]MPY52985.1 hypothetical protein [Streptomyces acidicola]